MAAKRYAPHVSTTSSGRTVKLISGLVGLPECRFLLVSISNHSPEMHRFRATGMGQTDRQTDGRIAALHNVHLYRGGGGVNNPNFNSNNPNSTGGANGRFCPGGCPVTGKHRRPITGHLPPETCPRKPHSRTSVSWLELGVRCR